MMHHAKSVLFLAPARLLCVMLCVALVACAQVQPKPEPAPAPTPPPLVVELPPAPPPPPDEIGPLLSYHQSLRRMSQGELLKELSGLGLQQRSPRVAVQMLSLIHIPSPRD